MEYTILAMACGTFAMVVYIMATIPTKKDLRKLTDDACPREAELGRMLRERIGSSCELVLSEAGVTAGDILPVRGAPCLQFAGFTRIGRRAQHEGEMAQVVAHALRGAQHPLDGRNLNGRAALPCAPDVVGDHRDDEREQPQVVW